MNDKNGILQLKKILESHLFHAALILFAAVLMASSSFYHDDTMIELRYVYNLLHHGELVWNSGERVQGYTNLLHLLFVALISWLGVPLYVAPRVVNFLSFIGLLIAVGSGLRLALPASATLAKNLAWAALLCSTSIPIWIWGGLESVMIATFVTAAFAALIPVLRATTDHPLTLTLWSGFFFSLAILTRIDAVLIGVITGIFLLVYLAPDSKIKVALFFALIPVLTLGGLLCWQYLYYGDIFPNTVYAKTGVSFAMRWHSVKRYFYVSPVYWAAITSFAVLYLMYCAGQIRNKISATSSGSDALLKLIACMIVMQFVYIVWVGGDHMPGGRFYVPLLGVAAIGVGIIAHRMAGTALFAVSMICAASCVVTIVKPQMHDQNNMLIDEAASKGLAIGQYMSKNFAPGSLTALSGAGAEPFASIDLRFIDTLGLNDRHIGQRKLVAADIRAFMQNVPGHLKGDGKYILSRKPDYIILGPPEGAYADHPWFLSDVELAESPEFYRCYAVNTVDVDSTQFVYYSRTCPKDG